MSGAFLLPPSTADRVFSRERLEEEAPLVLNEREGAVFSGRSPRHTARDLLFLRAVDAEPFLVQAAVAVRPSA